MFQKIRELWSILKFFIMDNENLLFHLMEVRAHAILRECSNIGVDSVEEIEDLLFHIKLYYEIPEAVAETRYTKFRGIKYKDLLNSTDDGINTQEITDYIIEVETQRALERELIFEHAKSLDTLGFVL